MRIAQQIKEMIRNEVEQMVEIRVAFPSDELRKDIHELNEFLTSLNKFLTSLKKRFRFSSGEVCRFGAIFHIMSQEYQT